MTPTEGNLAQQTEEIEVLSSIFLDRVTVHSSTQFDVRIEPEAVLRVTFPSTYPSEMLPIFELSAPMLSKKRKDQLGRQLEQIGCQYQGLPVVFTWVEAIQERLFQWSHHSKTGEKGRKAATKNANYNPGVDLCPQITSGAVIEDRKSVFQAHFAVVDRIEQVEAMLAKLKTNRKISNAKHNMLAYRMKAHDGSVVQDFDNDGENQGGSRLLHLLEAAGALNVAVVVTRWFGGIQIGPDRFKHINTAARAILEAEGVIGKGNAGKSKRKRG
ncbi:protein IMPACT-like [Tigriopus californicus]|uniref:protein IMPACT-like n=1 Tax=Tigriopus californicus TaxID=6832 RepID=UPI0027DAA44F|nr:protein IMPACT-like [Tigriopus californicus]|eukprot:TCALIF_02992-PA protein Name:"Similar to impact-B Protein IMPACT-B (Xenopus tropicalis)" AED:0.16 eAED:0.16 QI:0/0.5/0.33/0.66/1/1/3/58/270